MMTKKRLALFGTLGLSGVILIAIVTYVSYFAISGRALPQTHIGDLNVGGMSKSEIESKLTSNVRTISAKIGGQGVNDVTANLATLGASLDVSKTTSAALTKHRSVGDYLTSVFTKPSVDPVLAFVDVEKIEKFARSLTEGQESITPPTDPHVELKDDTFVVVPGTDGQGVPAKEVKRVANVLAHAQKTISVKVKTVDLPAKDPSEELKQIAKTANDIVATEVTLVVGNETLVADAVTKASWIKVVDGEPEIDRETVSKWVTESSKPLEAEAVVGMRYKSASGEILKVKTEPHGKKTVTNIDDIVQQIATNFIASQPTAAVTEVTEGEKTWEEKVVAAGAENLPYLAAEGEKWIDVNLSNFSAIGYEGATQVRGPALFVPGSTNTPTVTGEFKVWHKVAQQNMTGRNLDGSTYHVPNVPWVMYFHGDYAIHGAPWFSSFGYHAGDHGSHGCLNMSVDDAHTLFDWAPIGTVVLSHY
ncbi:L,D-transpeptidase family protein [Arcanobacterium phocae]|uniref:L,D-transpeptidase family protein n=2 Tax=Arcanobacterium phocae TaxID=131112 RepID=UPI001C1110F6|nr:L,D-transpeptidase family protein [Arcanobacterium phocae]